MALPRQIVEMMASRVMRMHHYLWHQVRNMWLFYDDATREKIRALGWEPPRPAQEASPSGGRRPIYQNASGEDFLYMHRDMIAAVNRRLAEIGDDSYPKVEGWRQVPRPTDKDFPVPPAWATGDADLDSYLQQSKSEEFFNSSFVVWEKDFTDTDRLRGMSLGELGARIEFTIHNRMHMRWCSNPGTMRPDVDPTRPDDIDSKWDMSSYDWLGDTYSSHVNPIFWKLHGWVDDRIEDWARSNDIKGPIDWTGRWLGKKGHDHGSMHAQVLAETDASQAIAEQLGSELSQLLALVKRSGIVHQFHANVEV